MEKNYIDLEKSEKDGIKKIYIRKHWKLSDVPSLQKAANNKNIADRLRDTFPHPYTMECAKFWVNLCTKNLNDLRKTEKNGKIESLVAELVLPIVAVINKTNNTKEKILSASQLFNNDQDSRNTIKMEEDVIGCISIRSDAELGYWLAEPYWGQGIMTAATIKFSHYLFEQFRESTLPKILALTLSQNKASQKVLFKSGFKHMGILKMNPELPSIWKELLIKNETASKKNTFYLFELSRHSFNQLLS